MVEIDSMIVASANIIKIESKFIDDITDNIRQVFWIPLLVHIQNEAGELSSVLCNIS